LSLAVEDMHTFVSNEFAIWPVASLELREDKHAFIADFKSTCSWNLLEKWRIIYIIIWDKIVVKIEWQVFSWDLIFHHHSIWDSFDNCCGYFLEEFDIFGFIMASIPMMLFAILTRLDNKISVVMVHI